MKAATLFSGGKDSTYAAYLAQSHGFEISCLLTVKSENKESYMFHTPSITQVKKQAEVMNIPLLVQSTEGKKDEELIDLEVLIARAKDEFQIQGIVTGTVESAYQASRIQKICDTLELNCFNPLWQKNQIELLHDLVRNHFEVIIVGIFAYPLDSKWLGRYIDKQFIADISDLYHTYQINPSGEGGETESFVLHCPLFSKPLSIVKKTVTGKQNAWSMEIEVL